MTLAAAGDDATDAGEAQVDAMSGSSFEAEMNSAGEALDGRKGKRIKFAVGIAEAIVANGGADSANEQGEAAVSAKKLLITATISAVLCFGLAACAEAQEALQNSSDESWTATTEGSTENVTPWRRMERHTKSGNRTVDKLRVEVLGPDAQFVPDTEIETETVRMSDSVTRTVVRTYKWDGNRRRTLAQVTEEEARSTASGDGQVVSTTSSFRCEREFSNSET